MPTIKIPLKVIGIISTFILAYLCYDNFFSVSSKDRAIATEMCNSVNIGMNIENLKAIQSRSKVPFHYSNEIAVIRYGAWVCPVFLKNGIVASLPSKPSSEH
jgi:hypothetical protein